MKGATTSGPLVPAGQGNVHRVAFGATVMALVLYVVACFVVDLVVVDRLNASIDARLTTRLHQVVPTFPAGGPKGTIGSYSPQFSGDYDDAPIVLWWVPGSRLAAVGLDTNGPRLPVSAVATASPRNATVGGRPFRLAGTLLGDGRLIAGTTAQQVRTALSSLLGAEAVLGPVALIMLYGAAWVIGRSAAAPVERARLRQLEFTADALSRASHPSQRHRGRGRPGSQCQTLGTGLPARPRARGQRNQTAARHR